MTVVPKYVSLLGTFLRYLPVCSVQCTLYLLFTGFWMIRQVFFLLYGCLVLYAFKLPLHITLHLLGSRTFIRTQIDIFHSYSSSYFAYQEYRVFARL